MDVRERFAHIPDDAKTAAVEGFVRLNPHQRGIDFDTMMQNILDCDAHLAILGDVLVEGEEATKLVTYLAMLGTRHPSRGCAP
jgi:predicted nicotinamide N-methyase